MKHDLPTAISLWASFEDSGRRILFGQTPPPIADAIRRALLASRNLMCARCSRRGPALQPRGPHPVRSPPPTLERRAALGILFVHHNSLDPSSTRAYIPAPPSVGPILMPGMIAQHFGTSPKDHRMLRQILADVGAG